MLEHVNGKGPLDRMIAMVEEIEAVMRLDHCKEGKSGPTN